ncbi:MAG: hypothetical protein ACI35O_13210, partial [Bacillaceae bacterium]
MMKYKRIIIFLLVGIFIFCAYFPTYTEASSNYYSNTDNKNAFTPNEHKYVNYQLETHIDTNWDWLPWQWGDGVEHGLFLSLAAIVDALWNLNVVMSSFTIFITGEAFNLDFVGD